MLPGAAMGRGARMGAAVGMNPLTARARPPFAERVFRCGSFLMKSAVFSFSTVKTARDGEECPDRLPAFSTNCADAVVPKATVPTSSAEQRLVKSCLIRIIF